MQELLEDEQYRCLLSVVPLPQPAVVQDPADQTVNELLVTLSNEYR